MIENPDPTFEAFRIRAQSRDARAETAAARQESEALRARVQAARERTRALCHDYAEVLRALAHEPGQPPERRESLGDTTQLREAIVEYSLLLRETDTPPEDSLRLVKSAADEVIRQRRDDRGHVADHLARWFCDAYYASAPPPSP